MHATDVPDACAVDKGCYSQCREKARAWNYNADERGNIRKMKDLIAFLNSPSPIFVIQAPGSPSNTGYDRDS